MNAERRRRPGHTSWDQELQWGRVRVNAESLWQGDGNDGSTIASMGPRSCERGKLAFCSQRPVSELLQWGRVRVNAESTTAGERRQAALAKLQWGRVRVNAERYRTD